jgi:hypothetical protein
MLSKSLNGVHVRWNPRSTVVLSLDWMGGSSYLNMPYCNAVVAVSTFLSLNNCSRPRSGCSAFVSGKANDFEAALGQ